MCKRCWNTTASNGKFVFKKFKSSLLSYIFAGKFHLLSVSRSKSKYEVKVVDSVTSFITSFMWYIIMTHKSSSSQYNTFIIATSFAMTVLDMDFTLSNPNLTKSFSLTLGLYWEFHLLSKKIWGAVNVYCSLYLWNFIIYDVGCQTLTVC